MTDAEERRLWEFNPLAFWLDPDRWHGVKDPWRDMLWDHLDERPQRYPRIPEAPRRTNAQRDDALELLAEANAYEEAGCHDLAVLMRRRAVWRWRERH